MEPDREHFCGACRRKEYAFDLARSYGIYARTLRAAILELKFRRRERWARGLGGLLIHLWPSVAGRLSADPLLIPVPLHPSRQRERGFNQAELLARGFQRKLGRSTGFTPQLNTTCFRRVRATVPQSGLGQRARLENVKHVFAANPEVVRGRSIILLDDVITTGATASACAVMLKQAGALQVIVLSLARATPQYPGGVMPLNIIHPFQVPS
jgi:ComF family protein